MIDDFDYGDEQDDATRLEEQRRHLLEEERRLKQELVALFINNYYYTIYQYYCKLKLNPFTSLSGPLEPALISSFFSVKRMRVIVSTFSPNLLISSSLFDVCGVSLLIEAFSQAVTLNTKRN